MRFATHIAGSNKPPDHEEPSMYTSQANDAVPEAIDEEPTVPRNVFADRRAAGHLLGRALFHLAGTDAIVLGLARGGVVVADEVARVLGLPLDVWLVLQIGVPFRPELGMAALAEGANLVLDRELIRWTSTTDAQLSHLVHHASNQIRDRARRYRGDRSRADVRGKTAIIVDDGLANNGRIHAAVGAVRKCGATKTVVAAPVATPAALDSLRHEADEVVCLATHHQLRGVGAWYHDFHQVSDREVARLLAQR